MTTFVLLVFFWESARGYAITNIPGYDTRTACEASVAEIVQAKPGSSYSYVKAICVPGPNK